jgi:hypothetical protein
MYMIEPLDALTILIDCPSQFSFNFTPKSIQFVILSSRAGNTTSPSSFMTGRIRSFCFLELADFSADRPYIFSRNPCNLSLNPEHWTCSLLRYHFAWVTEYGENAIINSINKKSQMNIMSRGSIKSHSFNKRGYFWLFDRCKIEL